MRALAFFAATLLLVACASPTSSKPAAIPVANPGLIISEVMNAGAVYNSLAVEVYNPTNVALDLSTYQLRTSSHAWFDTTNYSATQLTGMGTFDLPSLVVAPQGYAVIRARVMKDFTSGGATSYVDDGAANNAAYPWADSTQGSVELLQGGGTADFVRWGTGNGTSPTSSGFPFQGTASAIAPDTNSATYAGYSWTRDRAESNTKSASDWAVREWATLGGPNDITSDTDADNDGIPDEAEAPGHTFAGLDLYGWGARTGQRDIFIHIDYQVNGSVAATDPGIIPQKAALDKLVAAFAADPNGGIKLHLDVGDLWGAYNAASNPYNLDGRSHALTSTHSGSIALGLVTGFDNVYQYKTASLPAAKSKVFFYMVFADTQLPQSASRKDGSSGIANLPGNTSIITLGHWGLTTMADASPGTKTASQNTNILVNYQAATMMHEFGHNLGLHHGGADDDNYKPNYFSVMNYLYQLDGLPAAGHEDTRYYAAYAQNWGGPTSTGVHKLNAAWTNQADSAQWTDSAASGGAFVFTYSNGTGGTLNESAPSETAGIQRSGSAGIDFSNDGTIGGSATWGGHTLRYLLDPNLSAEVTPKILNDFNDWAAIDSVFQHSYQSSWSGIGPRSASAPSVPQLFVESAPTSSQPCLSPFTPKVLR